MRLLLGFAAVLASLASGSPIFASPSQARHTTGAVTIRGVAHGVHSRSFTLQTTTRGTYSVDTSPPTEFTEKGHSGKVTPAEGDHVGVRGIVKGRSIRAIEVRIYPTQPKQESLRGTVRALSGNRLTLQVGSRDVTVLLTSSTEIRTSSGTVSASSLRTGDKVDARVIPSGKDVVALHIHLYRQKAVLRHVQLHGTVISAGAAGVTVAASGRRYTVRVTASTRFYAKSSGGARSLRPGMDVTVYACCAGQPLVATSVHVRVTPVTSHAVDIRGRVIELSPTAIRLDAQHGLSISLASSTVYEVGSSRVPRTGVRVGDQVSVRASRQGNGLQAMRVHVYASSRTPHTVRGTVIGVSGSAVTVRARGATYSVRADGRTVARLAGRPVHAGDLRPGDRVVAVGLIDGHVVHATSVTATRPAPKTHLVRGSVAQVGGSSIVVVATSGKRYTVRVTPGTRVVLQGKPVPVTSLFPGLHATARGALSGSVLSATAVTVTATGRTASGRVVAVSVTALTVSSSSGRSMHVDVPPGVSASDGGRRVAPSSLHVGAYVHVSGYEEPSRAIRATSLAVMHPVVDIHGSLTWKGGVATVRTSTGQTYTLRFAPSSSVRSSVTGIALKPSDIPTGSSVHARGIAGSDGTIAVTALTVRLRSVTLRATISAMDPKSLTVGGQSVRLQPTTVFEQGSKTIAPTDLVVGDDVTVYGYRLGPTTILSRKILLHRRLLGIDGTVASIDGNAFSLSAADGTHQVLVGPTTIVSGPAGTVLAAGMKVHVTGYLRGDGVLLATRLRLTLVKAVVSPTP